MMEKEKIGNKQQENKKIELGHCRSQLDRSPFSSIIFNTCQRRRERRVFGFSRERRSPCGGWLRGASYNPEAPQRISEPNCCCCCPPRKQFCPELCSVGPLGRREAIRRPLSSKIVKAGSNFPAQLLSGTYQKPKN